ncbi:MAG TPA: fumarylacetoacetate hydrolase family protein [Roseiflexaceae bacterium]|nr:fumarylacetoacetate hydrolase family protein [Roseiflexaceae bacterium]HMP42057.1 fumarylacetoacetate hydrolase family protein [Roseiflexaceae bacterium]
MHLCRFYHPERGVRFGIAHAGTLYDVSNTWAGMAMFLQWSARRADLDEAIMAALGSADAVGPVAAADRAPDPAAIHLLKPIDNQEVWAAGVTYERSRVAREEESAGSGIYDRVYSAPRPEIFFKASPSRTVGSYEAVAIRRDSQWNVPEPELGLLINPAMELVGFLVGNDMSSRDIEGENPLYLPQAKVYGRCCALSSLVALRSTIADPKDLTVQLTIRRDTGIVFNGDVSTGKIVRPLAELIEYLGRDNLFLDGVVLLTGTGIVPPDDFSLAAGDQVSIAIDGIGTLHNQVMLGI